MAEELKVVAESTCTHCGMKILRLENSQGFGKWTHEWDKRDRCYVRTHAEPPKDWNKNDQKAP